MLSSDYEMCQGFPSTFNAASILPARKMWLDIDAHPSRSEAAEFELLVLRFTLIV